MIIEINTDNLIKSDLTPTEYVICYIIYERATNTFEHFKLHMPQIVTDVLEELMGKEYVTKASNRIGFSTTSKFIEEIVKPDSFDELLSLFPVYVTRPDGLKDYLRTDKVSSKRKYTRIIGKRGLKHTHIMKCLKYEIETRIQENSIRYMKRLPNWIDSREWEIWEERMENEPLVTNTPTYGTELE